MDPGLALNLGPPLYSPSQCWIFLFNQLTLLLLCLINTIKLWHQKKVNEEANATKNVSILDGINKPILIFRCNFLIHLCNNITCAMLAHSPQTNLPWKIVYNFVWICLGQHCTGKLLVQCWSIAKQNTLMKKITCTMLS